MGSEMCIRDRCDGVHRIEDCPVTSEQDKKRLLQEHIAKLRKNPRSENDQSSKRQRQSGRSFICDGMNYNVDVVIAGVETVARDDTGADMTVIPVSLLTRILEQKMKMPVRKLDKAIEIDLAVKGNDIPKVIIDREIHANIQIKLPGSRLPVLLRNVKISVTTHEMDVVLFGKRPPGHVRVQLQATPNREIQ